MACVVFSMVCAGLPTFVINNINNNKNNNNNNTKHFLALTPAGAESDLNASTNGA